MDPAMESTDEPVIVSQGPLAQMRELERVLLAEDLATADVVSPPGGGSG